MTQPRSTTFFTVVEGAKYLSLTTYRKNGQAVATPVWFAHEGDALYVFTYATSGKVKRLRNNPQVEIAPCTVRGEVTGASATGIAQIHADGSAVAGLANRALNRKYGLIKRLFDLMGWLQRTERIYLELKPAP